MMSMDASICLNNHYLHLCIRWTIFVFSSITILTLLVQNVQGQPKQPQKYQPKQQQTQQAQNFHIGAVLRTRQHVEHFEKVIDDLNFEDDHRLPAGVRLHGHSILIEPDEIANLRNFCRNLMPFENVAIIIDDSSDDDHGFNSNQFDHNQIESNSIVFTLSIFAVPIIGLTNRHCLYSDKSLYYSYMRTTPTYAQQADVWIQLLKYFEFECVHFIVSDSINGRYLKTRFLQLSDYYNLDIETIIEYDSRRPRLRHELNVIRQQYNTTCRIYCLYIETDAEKILAEITAMNMTGNGNVWIVSEQALFAANLPVGFLAIRYRHQQNVEAHIADSVDVIANALKDMHRDGNLSAIADRLPPKNCHNIGGDAAWPRGELLYRYLIDQTIIFGKTGKLSFNEYGDRRHGEYEIWNQQANIESNQSIPVIIGNSILKNVGHFYYDRNEMQMKISINQSAIVWPGNQTVKPKSYSTPEHLNIVTLAEIPFVWVLPMRKGQRKCSQGQVLCPIRRRRNNTDRYYYENYCCEGYCIDLLIQLSQQLNFTYHLYQVEDGLYGSYKYNRQTGHHEWSGLLGELYYGHADMVIAALTITPERSLAIDFTKPFKYQGITILQKQQAIHRLGHPLTSFLQPFQNSLWVSVFVAVHVVALALYLLDRFSPFGRYKLPNCETITEEDALNLSSAIWFAWGVLFNSGIGEGTPRSFSGRVLGMVWAGFAMIIVASYTANLAAFLVLDRPQTALSGINDPRLRTPPEGFNYSTVRDSAVDNYFKRQVELKLMHQRMSEIFFNNVEDAIAAVKSGTLSAFIWDSARLEYEAANDCELIISGEHFGRSGYAIGLPKDKIYWKDRVSLALLGMHESGFMEDLDQKWILLNEKVCSIRTEHFPPTLGLKNMAGVFILVATGILGGIGLIMFEIFYKQHQTRKLKRMELARNAWDRWKELVQKRKLRKESLKLAAQQRYLDHQALHRRRQQMRHYSKSLSDERFSTSSSIEMIDSSSHPQSSISLPQDGRCANDYTTGRPVQPPTYLELKHINTCSAVNNRKHQLMQQEQHPMANARIRNVNKPKLRREYSIGYETTTGGTQAAATMPQPQQSTSKN